MLSLLLRISRTVVRIYRTGKVDSFINNVRNIEAYLQSSLNDIRKISSETQEFVLNNDNKTIQPKVEVDARIAKYSDILKAYTNPNDNNALNMAITVFYWLVFIAFGSMILVLSGWLNIGSYTLLTYLFLPAFLIICLSIQKLFAGNVVRIVHGKFMQFFGILSALCILVLLVHLFSVNWSVISTSVILLLAPVLLGVLLTSALFRLCGLNRTLIGIQIIVYTATALVISIMYSFILPMARGDAGVLVINLIATLTVLFVIGILWKCLKVSYVEFSSAQGLLGALLGGFEGLIVGGIIALICNIFGAAYSVTYTVLTLPTLLATFLGFFWNGFESSREAFSLPYAAWGILRGTVVFIPALFTETGRYYPSDAGCGCIFVPAILALSLAWRLAALPFVIIGGICYGFVVCGTDQDFDLEW